jgi:hypothetical protein
MPVVITTTPGLGDPAKRQRFIGYATLAFVLVLAGIDAAQWYLPHEPLGVAVEAALFLATLGLAALLALLLDGVGWLGRRAPALRLGLLALALHIVLRVVDPGLHAGRLVFGAERTWLYAPEGCEFGVRFGGKGSILSGRVKLADGREIEARRALRIDARAAAALGAECVVFAAAVPAEALPALRAQAIERLRYTAAQAGMTVERLDETPAPADGAGAGALPLAVLLVARGAGRDAANAPIHRRFEGRVFVGARSLVAIWAVAVVPGAEAPFPPAARRFTEGVARR